jgi:hypothetical protein
VRNFGWAGDADRAVVLVPKFRGRFLARWLLPLLGRPNFRVRLDADGSFVWAQCDGGTTVLEMADRLHRRLGSDSAAVRDRVARFVETLARDRLVTLDPSGEAHEHCD